MLLRGRRRGREEIGAEACVGDVWLAVQRRRPGVPRRSFGISLTPPLIISLFFTGRGQFRSGIRNAPYKSRAAASSREQLVRAQRCPSPYMQSERMCVTRAHARIRRRASGQHSRASSRAAKEARVARVEAACKFAGGIIGLQEIVSQCRICFLGGASVNLF